MASVTASSSESPIIPRAPRIETTAKKTRYEFKNVKDLVACINDGTFKFVVQINSGGWARSKRLNVNLLGKYGDRDEGAIHIGVMRKTFDIYIDPEDEETGKKLKKSLLYPFMQDTADDYYLKEATNDTQADWDAVRSAYLVPLLAALKQYYTHQVITVYKPVHMKMDFPSAASVSTINENGEKEVTEPSFDLVTHMKARGDGMVRFGSMWVMEQKTVDHLLVGFKMALDKTKYLTDTQRRENAEELEAEKIAEALEKAKVESARGKRSKI